MRGPLGSLLISLLALPLCTSVGAAAERFELDVMSFNIRYGTAKDKEHSWPNRRELVFGLIRREQPIVIGLQEALDFQIKEILKALPQYQSFGVGRDDGKTKGEYTAILYLKDRLEKSDGGTFWLSDTPSVVASTHWGNGIPRTCTWARFVEKKTGLPFTVYNVHLDHRSQYSRERSAELVAQRIATRKDIDPYLVLGDFNAGEDNNAVKFLKGELPQASKDGIGVRSPGLVDTFRVHDPVASEVGTFNGFQGRTTGAKIDHIFAPAWVKVLRGRILQDGKNDGKLPSDHFPVTAKVIVPRIRKS